MGVAVVDKDVADLSKRFLGRRGGEAPPIGASSRVGEKSALVLGADGNYHWQEVCATATGEPIKFNGHEGHVNSNGKPKKKRSK